MSSINVPICTSSVEMSFRGTNSQEIHEGTNWRALMSCESKPDVNSMPMHAGKRSRYNRRRFGLRYHGTLSSLARRVRIGSDAPVWAFSAVLKATIFASFAQQRDRRRPSVFRRCETGFTRSLRMSASANDTRATRKKGTTYSMQVVDTTLLLYMPQRDLPHDTLILELRPTPVSVIIPPQAKTCCRIWGREAYGSRPPNYSTK